MNALGVSLGPREARRLKHLLEEFLRDAEGQDMAELAAAFMDDRRDRPGESWLFAYLAESGTPRELARALTFCRRAEVAKHQAQAYRQHAKARHLDRIPATPAQLKALKRLAESRPWLEVPPPEALSKLQAILLIQRAQAGSLAIPSPPGGPWGYDEEPPLQEDP